MPTPARRGALWSDTERSDLMFWLEDDQKRKNGLQETQGSTGYSRAAAELDRSNLALRIEMKKIRDSEDRRALILRTFTNQTKGHDPAALSVWQAAFSALPASPTLAPPPSLLPAVSTTPVHSPPSSSPFPPGSSHSSPPESSFSPVLMAVPRRLSVSPGTQSQSCNSPPKLSTSVSSAPSDSSVENNAMRFQSSSTEQGLSIQPRADLWHSSHRERFPTELLVQAECALALMQFAGKPKPSPDQILHALVIADEDLRPAE